MSKQILEENIVELLGVDGLNDEEKVAFVSEIGDLVMESAMLRLISGLSPEQTEALDQFLDMEPEPDVLMNHLLKHHTDFENIIEEEIVAFKQDAIDVLGEKAPAAA